MVWKLRQRRTLYCFTLLCSILFFASCKFDEPVKEYFEYWSSTCQVGKIEYASENVTVDNVPNLSASDFIDIDVYTINPKNFKLLLNPSNGSSFSFQNESGNLYVSDYSETMVDPTYIKIRAKFSDESEGQLITLSGCLWPENRTAFSEDDLRVQSPELFYSTSFIQNTPPDNIKNLQRAEDFFPGTHKCYISFEVPDQSLNRNKNSTYEVKYYFREDDGSLSYRGNKVLTLADNKNPSAGSDVFMYYFDEQHDDFLTRYEYTVQMTGPHGLTVELRTTDPALGACVLVESVITVLDTPNGLSDEDSDGDYECYEVLSDGDAITFTAVPGQAGDELTVTDNGNELAPTGGNTYTVSGLGRHEIKATSSRTDAFSVTVTKRLRIETTPNPATFTFSQDFNGLKDESDPNNVVEYTEVEEPDSTVTYSISPTDERTTVSGNVDGTDYTNTVSGTLEIGLHKLVSIIHKEYCQPVTLVRNIMVARKLQEPEYTFNPPLNGKTFGEYEYLEVTSSSLTAGCTIQPSSADSNAKVSVKIGDGTASSPATQYIGELPVGDNTITVTVSKDYMTPREFTRNIKVDSKLTKPEITCTNLNGKKDSMGYEYIEVDDSNSKASYNVTNKDSRTDDTSVTTIVTAMPDDTNVVSRNNSGQLDTGTPGSPKKYKIVATVKKEGYVDQTTTKLVAVVTKLKTPKIEFGKDFNGMGKDSSGYLYIEVPDSTTIVSYTSSSDDNSGSNNPVTVSTKIGGWANPNTGTLNTNIGEYDITVTASCAFQNDATYTTKVKVVQELQEPNYLFTPGLTSESEDKWIEVPKTNHDVSCSITARNNGESLIVKDGSNTISSPANFTISSLGNHTLSVTVSRANYISKTFSKSVTIVEELQEPNYSFTPDLTSESNGEWIEVPSTDHNVICKITAQNSAESLTVRDNSTSISSSISSPANFTISSLGDHTLSVTVSRTSYKSRTFSKTVKIVEELQEPTYSFNPGLTTESGNKWIEVPSTDHNVSCKITAKASDEKIKVTEDGTTLYNTGSSPANFTLNTLGDHTLTITVTKDKYKTQTFTKTIKIVEELQEPDETIAYDGSTVNSSGTINYNSYSYPVYKIDLNPDGTGELWYRFTPKEEGASIKVEDCVSGTPVEIDREGTLALGPHKLKFTITKDGYTPQYYTKDIYVQGTLTTPEIKSTNGTYKSGNGDSNTTPQIWQFSYISYDSLKCNIKPGNTGNTVEVHKDSETGTTMSNPTTGFGLGYDTTIKLVIIQSREHCESLTTTKYVKGIIKPIKLSYNNNNSGTGMLYVYLSGFNKDKFDMKGTIKVNGHVAFSYLNSNRNNVNQKTWQELGDSGNPSFTITCNSPSDDITVSVSSLRRNVGNAKDDPDDDGIGGECTKCLFDLKSEKSDTTHWVLLSDTISQKSRSVRPKIIFNVSE